MKRWAERHRVATICVGRTAMWQNMWTAFLFELNMANAIRDANALMTKLFANDCNEASKSQFTISGMERCAHCVSSVAKQNLCAHASAWLRSTKRYIVLHELKKITHTYIHTEYLNVVNFIVISQRSRCMCNSAWRVWNGVIRCTYPMLTKWNIPKLSAKTLTHLVQVDFWRVIDKWAQSEQFIY